MEAASTSVANLTERMDQIRPVNSDDATVVRSIFQQDKPLELGAENGGHGINGGAIPNGNEESSRIVEAAGTRVSNSTRRILQPVMRVKRCKTPVPDQAGNAKEQVLFRIKSISASSGVFVQDVVDVVLIRTNSIEQCSFRPTEQDETITADVEEPGYTITTMPSTGHFALKP